MRKPKIKYRVIPVNPEPNPKRISPLKKSCIIYRENIRPF